jgi:uncharacterized membrane protein
MMKKKAFLGITSETVVISILAIVFLGLALLFLGYLFGSMNINLKDVFGSVTKQRIESLKMSEKAFDLEFYTTDLKPGEKKTMFILLRNQGNSENYKWFLTHTQSNLSSDLNCNNITVSYKQEISVLPGQDSTPPLIIEANKNSKKGTCVFNFQAKDSTNSIETKILTINLI